MLDLITGKFKVWLYMAVAIAVVAVLSYIQYLRMTVANLELKDAVNQVTISALTSANENFEASTKLQNEKLDDLIALGTKQQTQMDSVAQQVQKGQSKLYEKIDQYRNTNVPKDCEGAVQWAATKGGEIGKW